MPDVTCIPGPIVTKFTDSGLSVALSVRSDHPAGVGPSCVTAATFSSIFIPCACAVDATAATAMTANNFFIPASSSVILPSLRESQQQSQREQTDAGPAQHGVIGSCPQSPNYNPRSRKRESCDQNRTHDRCSGAVATSSRSVPSISKMKSAPNARDGV